MKENYYFLWNYNKFPFIYSILKKNEKNILVINIQNNKNLKNKLSKLNNLEKIEKIILMENNIKEYICQIFYRIFIFPFKRKKISLFVDGIPGYVPIFLANLGTPNNFIYYEEGESLYIKNYIFLKKVEALSVKNFINNFIKVILFCPKHSIKDIKKFYVRDKKRFNKLLQKNDYISNFEIIEVNENKKLMNISTYDKELLKNIFLSKVNIKNTSRKKAIILTQPLYLDNPFTREETIKLFNDCIEKLKSEDYDIYLKLHPKEINDDNYIKENVKRIGGEFPFELLSILDINFDMGVTYNSTAINSSIIKEKILLKKFANKKY